MFTLAITLEITINSSFMSNDSWIKKNDKQTNEMITFKQFLIRTDVLTLS